LTESGGGGLGAQKWGKAAGWETKGLAPSLFKTS